jgi:NAD-dependent dihydropyrimidine dehydrogenase PreA subunit
VIEVVSTDRCIGCDVCVAVCPTNVFDPDPGGPPVIARQADCRTCFVCETSCPADALFVAPHACPLPVSSPLRDEAYLTATGLLGREIGPPARHQRARPTHPVIQRRRSTSCVATDW